MPIRPFPVLSQEQRRLAALRAYQLGGPSPEAEFDHVARLAADLFQAPTALVSFVEQDSQFFKARVGFSACETSRDVSFCAHALADDDVLVIPDARADDRFADNPLVTSDPFIRFYAGAPIITPDGDRLGTVCIIDTKPRAPLTSRQKSLLRSLAQIVTDHLEMRRLDMVRRGAMSLAAATPDAIICSDDDYTITFWNLAAERMFGYSRTEAMGQSLWMIVPSDCRAAYEAALQALAGGNTPFVGTTIDLQGQRRNGRPFPIEFSLAVWSDGTRRLCGSIIRDVSDKFQAKDRVRQLTHFDRLTALPNRPRFLEEVDVALRNTGRFTLLKIGLDRFKSINGSLGMAAGDQVLAAAAKRIAEVADDRSTVARLGADEFGILVPGTDDQAGAILLADRVLDVFRTPFKVDGAICHVGASIGLVLCPGLAHFDAADHALKAALLALQHAKREGGRRHVLYTRQLAQSADDRRRLEEELRTAFTKGQFELHVQPQVALPTARIVGAEALLRWRHPERGLLHPGAFLPVLETSELALDVGRWVLHQSCCFAAALAAKGSPITIGVNLFAAQLEQPNLIDEISHALRSSGLPHHLLELEITETTILNAEEHFIGPLRQLRDLGVSLAFDDFGTGYASLSLLKRYPLTRLKIDREFVRDLDSDADDVAIVKAVVAMGASLGLNVIAEGVETVAQAAALVALGCTDAQGYLFGRPMPIAELERKLLADAEAIAA